MADVAGDVCVAVIAWSAAEPHRIGELAVLGADGSSSTLGRGDDDDPSAPRLTFFRQRPGLLDPRPPLASPGLSRRQLLIRVEGEGASLTRIGRCSLAVNGNRVDAAYVATGDVIEIGRELVILIVRRRPLIPTARYFPPNSAATFGEPDAFGILGESPAVWTVREAIAFVAKADRHVLITGPSGSGKELAARAIHELSPRARRTFVARNAAAIPPGLVDAELFGNAKNYPNSGMAERPGLIGEAAGGTLFLDEIGELSHDVQAHLLRVLDLDGEYQRLGESNVRRSDVRILGATNRDPSTIKHDFAARLATRLVLPALSERREDLPLLARRLVLRAAARTPEIAARFVVESADGHEYVRFEPSMMTHLLRRDYATNVRDLEAVLLNAMHASAGPVLALPSEQRTVADLAGPSRERSTPLVREPSAEQIRSALETSAGSVGAAARALGLSSRYVLYRLIRKHGLAAAVSMPDE
jgi:DNA-binding NtrC family response regulator